MTPHRQRLAQVPDLLSLAAHQPDRFPAWLDSAATGPLGRFSLLMFSPPDAERLVCASGGLPRDAFLDHLAGAQAQRSIPFEAVVDLPFVGGWFVYLGYEMAAAAEPSLSLPDAPDTLPDALAIRCPGAVVVHHAESPWAEIVAEDRATLAAIEQALEAPLPPVSADTHGLTSLEADPPAQFEAAVERIHEYLLDGDVFQVNVSRGWRGAYDRPPDPAAVYQHLRTANPAPFAGWLRWRDTTLMSSSPERLVEIRGLDVQTRPIAGTRPRGADDDVDRALSDELIGHPKERAEHIMLIDLERNDLGRVCETGSVEVDELMVVESYAHVHHIVSNVRGRLRRDATPADVIRAVFPGGTITGCPKVRCMQIIAELERHGRGFYTGAMGYLGRDGQMDLNILIRSMTLDGRQLRFRTGAGIVADSQPRAEVLETEAKAEGLLRALGRVDD